MPPPCQRLDACTHINNMESNNVWFQKVKQQKKNKNNNSVNKQNNKRTLSTVPISHLGSTLHSSAGNMVAWTTVVESLQLNYIH